MEDRKPILWNRNFVQCCISYFLMNFSFYMLMPTMPVYLVEVLGIDTASVGIALSSYTIGLLCVRPFSGFLVDCFSRKPLYLFAFFVFAFMFGGYLIATTMLTIMAVRFIQGGFMGLTSVAGNTIAIDVIPSSRRGEGWVLRSDDQPGDVAGAVGGRCHLWERRVSSGCLDRLGGGFYRSRFGLPDPLSEAGKGAAAAFFPRPFYPGEALPAALAYILVAIPYGMITSFVVLYGKEIEVADPGYFFIYMAIGVGTSRLISGRLVDHGKIHWVSVCSSVCLLVTFTVFATVHQSWVFFACALMIGIGYGVGVPAFQCLFVNVAPHNMRGTATSTYLPLLILGSVLECFRPVLSLPVPDWLWPMEWEPVVAWLRLAFICVG